MVWIFLLFTFRVIYLSHDMLCFSLSCKMLFLNGMVGLDGGELNWFIFYLIYTNKSIWWFLKSFPTLEFCEVLFGMWELMIGYRVHYWSILNRSHWYWNQPVNVPLVIFSIHHYAPVHRFSNVDSICSSTNLGSYMSVTLSLHTSHSGIIVGSEGAFHIESVGH